MAEFDWYAATVRENPDDLVVQLCDALAGHEVSSTPRHGYTKASQIRAGDSTVATVYSGGRNGHPHVFSSGDDAPTLAAVLRAFWPATHYVTRMDAKIDYDDGPGTWDRIYTPALALADERRIKISQAGDWHRLIDGRTLYLGAPSSAVRSRVYEKGKQLKGLALTEEAAAAISPDLVRLEVQVRPEGDARHSAAWGEPIEAFGYADWSKALLKVVEGVDVERVHIRERRESDLERALFFMCRQYGAHLSTLAEQVGGWDNVGPDLHRRIMGFEQWGEDHTGGKPF